MSQRKEITGRDGYIIVEALTFAVEALSKLPIEHRPDSNIDDMKRLIEAAIKQDELLANCRRSRSAGLLRSLHTSGVRGGLKGILRLRADAGGKGRGGCVASSALMMRGPRHLLFGLHRGAGRGPWLLRPRDTLKICQDRAPFAPDPMA